MKQDFREKVIAIVQRIRKGKTMTYGEVAALAGNPLAARAVGAIMRTNYRKDVPCHRVVAKSGLGGYNRGGSKTKESLLRSEGVTFKK